MYSVVLMVAMTGGVETPAFGFGCKGCNGCSCSYSCSCSGYGCSGGYGCNGCGGGYSCHGCNGGSCKCSGWSRKGCCGGGLFSRKCHGCHGCHGCCGGSYGCHGGYGCCGGYACTGCTGCTGGYACTGCTGCCGGMTAPATEAPKTIEKVKEPKVIEKGKTEAPSAAKIIVSLPADARLTVDGAVTTSTSDRRVFESPELAPGKTYSYTLKAEFTQDGKPVVVTKEVSIKAGAEVNVTIAAPEVVASR